MSPEAQKRVAAFAKVASLFIGTMLVAFFALCVYENVGKLSEFPSQTSADEEAENPWQFQFQPPADGGGWQQPAWTPPASGFGGGDGGDWGGDSGSHHVPHHPPHSFVPRGRLP